MAKDFDSHIDGENSGVSTQDIEQNSQRSNSLAGQLSASEIGNAVESGEIQLAQAQTQPAAAFGVEQIAPDALDQSTITTRLTATPGATILLPAFTMTVERKMFAYNAAFKNEIENLGPMSKEAKGQAGLKMVFSNPVNQTAERLKDGTRNSVTGYIGFSLGDKLVQRKASFCLVDKRLDNSPILVFIHP